MRSAGQERPGAKSGKGRKQRPLAVGRTLGAALRRSGAAGWGSCVGCCETENKNKRVRKAGGFVRSGRAGSAEGAAAAAPCRQGPLPGRAQGAAWEQRLPGRGAAPFCEGVNVCSSAHTGLAIKTDCSTNFACLSVSPVQHADTQKCKYLSVLWLLHLPYQQQCTAELNTYRYALFLHMFPSVSRNQLHFRKWSNSNYAHSQTASGCPYT